MGEQDLVQQRTDPGELRLFTKALLNDLRALEKIPDDGLIESGKRRLGAEQEVVLVDKDWRPAPVNMPVLERLADERFTTELGRFNIEFNLDPVDVGPVALSEMESQLGELLAQAREAASAEGAEVILTGILPTLAKSDLSLANMTPRKRYYALNEAMSRLRASRFSLRIKGRDELIVKHDNVMLESCNTSFQIHYQVAAEEFAHLYNIAQALAAPVLACATNSPLLFGRQLWRETRIALFQQSVDTRGATQGVRDVRPRVSFGRDWIEKSALEIFREDLAAFQVLLGGVVTEDPFEALGAGRAPDLTALRIHNGTVYRWNRPCYGISDGKPHLRIENRVIPSGPTTTDEMANAAFWFGLMSGMGNTCEDITELMDFACARENFVSAARLGLGADFTWLEGRSVASDDLILEELLPLARQGLASLGIDSTDSDRHLEVIEERVRSQKTGSQWLIDSFNGMKQGSQHERLAALVAASAQREKTAKPVHTWAPATVVEAGGELRHHRRVEQLMTTDLFTVNQDDLVDMVAYVMDWKHIRHVPVEDNQHHLVGLVTHRGLLRHLASLADAESHTVPIGEIMEINVVTVEPHASTREALELMRQYKISCLPVVDGEGKLVGIVTERDYMRIASPLLDEFLDAD